MGCIRRVRLGITLRYKTFTFLLLSCLCFYLVLKSSSGACSDHQVDLVIAELCANYSSGLTLGSLCNDLCSIQVRKSVECVENGNSEQLAFSVRMYGETVLLAKAVPTSDLGNNSSLVDIRHQSYFYNVLNNLFLEQLNSTLSPKTKLSVDKLLHGLMKSSKGTSSSNLHLAVKILLSLLHNKEYLYCTLYEEQELFPKIYGSCGHFYFMEEITPLQLTSMHLFTPQSAWADRIRYAVQIMDLLEHLDIYFSQPYRICDAKMVNFGETRYGKLVYRNLGSVHPWGKVQELTNTRRKCSQDADCDYFDCSSQCNPNTKICDTGQTNDNLQVVCEQIFLGWTMPGKLLVPGLLMTKFTPPGLMALMRQCAENGRSVVPEDVRQRLYTTLTEMEQQLSEL